MIDSFFYPSLGYLLAMALIWTYRSRRAMKTARLAPAVDPAYRYPAQSGELTSVIIPARNEEDNIAACLESLLNQDYLYHEIIVANDNSTDKTGEILKSFADRIRVVDVPPTPEGWTGKNFAIHTAIRQAKGKWYLFTDADTRHERSSLSASLSHAQSRDLEFLTLTPRCLTSGFWENVIQPAIMSFIGLWFPFDKINSLQSDIHFANGQYILIKRELYEKTGGHKAVSGEFLEDFALMRKTKQLKRRAECALGTSVYGTRMYTSLGAIWRGWRRICLHAFKSNPKILVLKMLDTLFFSVLLFFLWIPLTYAAFHYQEHYGFLWGAANAILGFILLTLGIAYGILKSKKRYAFLFPLGALFLAVVLGDAAWMAVRKKETKWR